MAQDNLPTTLDLIQQAFPNQVQIVPQQVGQLCGWTPASIRTLRSRGTFPIKSTSNGGKHRFDIRDVAQYLDSLRTPKLRRGAPTKLERLAREAEKTDSVK